MSIFRRLKTFYSDRIRDEIDIARVSLISGVVFANIGVAGGIMVTEKGESVFVKPALAGFLGGVFGIVLPVAVQIAVPCAIVGIPVGLAFRFAQRKKE